MRLPALAIRLMIYVPLAGLTAIGLRLYFNPGSGPALMTQIAVYVLALFFFVGLVHADNTMRSDRQTRRRM